MKKNNTPDMNRRDVIKALGKVGALTPAVSAASASTSTKKQAKGPTKGNTILFHEMSYKAKRAFISGVKTGKYNLGRPCDVPAEFVKYDYVKYMGNTYRLNTHSTFEARYGINLKSIKHGEIPLDASVVEYGNLTPSAKMEFKNGLDKNFVKTKVGFPKELIRNRFIKHKGDYYDTRPHHRDAAIYAIAPHKV